jgi:tetratricopeptide (TPR) repeat protein
MNWKAFTLQPMLLCLSLFLCLAPVHASEIDHSKGWGGMDGIDLLPMCQAEVEMEDGKNLQIDRMADAMHCANYLQGFLDGFVMGQLVPGATQVLCFPENVNVAQMIRIVAKWLHDNPDRLTEPAYGLVFVAIRDAFACQPAPAVQQGASPPSAPESMEGTKPSAENGKQGSQGSAQPSVPPNSLEALEDTQLSTEHNKAVADAKEGVRLKPTDGFAWYALGEAYVNLGDYTSAEEPFKRAVKALLAAPPEPGRPLKEQTSLLMAANATIALAQVCDRLHRKREAEHYRRSYLMLLESTR